MGAELGQAPSNFVHLSWNDLIICWYTTWTVEWERKKNSIARQPQLSCLFEQIMVYKDIKKHILEYTVTDTNIGLIGFSGIV